MQNHDNKSFKWLIGGTYNPCKTMTTNHLNGYIGHRFMVTFAKP